MVIGVIADTKEILSPAQMKALRTAFKGVDAVLHAGPIGDVRVLEQLKTIAPIHVVCGNAENFEIRDELFVRVLWRVKGLKIGLVHGYGKPVHLKAWLIKQFVDKHPRFYFVAEGETVPNAIPFDMFGAEFTHHGEDCTFETMLKRFGLSEVKGLRELGEIVHDVDLKDDKFQRLEAAGVNAVINGLSETCPDDRKRLQQATVIFDSLFRLLDKQGEKPGKPRAAPKIARKK